MIRINDRIAIPWSEIEFTASRSSGPGGQHVNTTDSRVTLLFDVAASQSLTQLEKMVVTGKLRRRIDKRGVLSISSQTFRSQKSNKDSAVDRFVELMRWALTPVTPRKDTAVPRSAKRKRLERKRHTADRKRQRKPPGVDE
ncbi:MAG: aminoacyl-tRNA hydrolase [Pseudodesulfovibrio sp.]|uniref:Class I peptide chain release factor n=1 Tax=Pseudodesulfovibrio aespoeensis (strain ATCC 700646 / DSM 10631 / Aspo-2) TaxID=643562 RepID=E6VRZ7_PSEA9|nr:MULTISPECIES: alternative ribosome rescue aminoacyl-tRNA hydrolase ArfB [Pseudodesulfovibrio]MBU4192635.1 aminoacyl-tRNA hydrolase [Pseudomonadota bacterium]ADU61930.1 Class I peptide chain release factor [Pseudodesulfovibrio aespoeensis Aspo-2]MBU4244662.1 aminoacyl-tRNA hydrolase [Pseudomonadota bacterium]MBU4379455.1 aminoacyl-tRNA hydrolase [Pseudomonadota bacterium]MBU4473694.1 aminoacyl-tRNA hydrolase [Pseudomonadota bacterium]